ncbi:hypothetical protein HPB48_003900 [Haemaphysalis longicornis]|uniref:Acyltransferase 3 domain-containing protein n=1 Tax=Haemaphysalis longicornis TaxID=44386 RepID=A0A9J6FEH1_HAELO|nr:hypothetical protein HPB48_003900 [Haemaphysalis longicornis]
MGGIVCCDGRDNVATGEGAEMTRLFVLKNGMTGHEEGATSPEARWDDVKCRGGPNDWRERLQVRGLTRGRPKGREPHASSSIESCDENTGGHSNVLAWRLTVPAMFVVGVWLLLPLMADGPVLNDYKATFLDTCQRRWWSVLLHTNNFSPFLEMCLGHLWYINIDFQLYVALLFIPLVMIRRPYLGALLAALATVMSSAYTGVVSYLNNYQPAVIFTHTDVNYTIGTANQIYFKPFAHVGSFCIGVLLGYYIYVAPKMKLSKPVQALCWCAAAACNLAIVFAPHKWYMDHTYSISRPECLLFASLHRVAWTLGVAWLVLACATGRGGIVTSLLSWPALVPLSRLSYGAFLCHVVILLAQMMTNRERIAYTYAVKTMNYFAVVMASYLSAYLLYLFCEAPVAALERNLLGGRRGHDAASSQLTVVVPKMADQPASRREVGTRSSTARTRPAEETMTQRSHL